MIVTAVGTGMRPGEVFGLTVDSVDFLRRQIQVDRQLVRVSSRPPSLEPLKTEESRCTIPLPDLVGTAMAAHLEEHQPHGVGLVFTLPKGGPIRRADWTASTWKQATAGLDWPAGKGLHSLRHYYASLLIHHGASVTVVQHRLGHSTPSETLGHLLPPVARLGRGNRPCRDRRARWR